MPDITYLGNPNLKKANVAQNWTKKELVEYQKCMDSPQYFIENYVKLSLWMRVLCHLRCMISRRKW